jgi:hypothetical protein
VLPRCQVSVRVSRFWLLCVALLRVPNGRMGLTYVPPPSPSRRSAVSLGRNLVVTRASNKVRFAWSPFSSLFGALVNACAGACRVCVQGAVAIALPLLLPDPVTGVPSVPTAFVFVTCHLASDLSGSWLEPKPSLGPVPPLPPPPCVESGMLNRACFESCCGCDCGGSGAVSAGAVWCGDCCCRCGAVACAPLASPGLSRLHVRNRDAADMLSALGLRVSSSELPPRRIPTSTSIPQAAWRAKEALLTSGATLSHLTTALSSPGLVSTATSVRFLACPHPPDRPTLPAC